MYGLGCMLVESRSFEVLSDYWVYMGSSPLAWLLSWSLIHLNFYKLDGSVTARTLHSLANPTKSILGGRQRMQGPCCNRTVQFIKIQLN